MDAARCYRGEAPFCDTQGLAPGRVHARARPLRNRSPGHRSTRNVDTVAPQSESSSCERLESEENLAFQERSRRWETIGRWLVVGVVIAALAGLMGSGPLSHGEAATRDGSLKVEYPRIARTDATYRFSVYVASSASPMAKLLSGSTPSS